MVVVAARAALQCAIATKVHSPPCTPLIENNRKQKKKLVCFNDITDRVNKSEVEIAPSM
jgi:hypothetical protein